MCGDKGTIQSTAILVAGRELTAKSGACTETDFENQEPFLLMESQTRTTGPNGGQYRHRVLYIQHLQDAVVYHTLRLIQVSD